MVTNQASIKRNGVQDYVSLRATAFIIALYTFFIAGFFITTDEVTFDVWHGLFSGLAMKVFTLAALVSNRTTRHHSVRSEYHCVRIRSSWFVCFVGSVR